MLQSYRRAGLADTVTFLDRLKDFGFRFATMGGVSIGIEDLEIPTEKAELLTEADARVKRFQRAYNTGQITFGERYNKVIDAWTHANNDVAEAMINSMRVSRGGFNPVFMMFDSGSRGSRDQIRQLAGMRGLMAKPQKKLTGGIGEIIESPIKSNFREGLTVLEYFISTHGARKGLADTALKTADAGYLTRRLVDVAQDVTITEEDCGTILGLEIAALKEGEDIIEPLRERILGSVAGEDVFDPHELDEDGDPEAPGRGRQADRRGHLQRDRRRRDREGQDPLGADLRGAPRHLPDVLRPEPGHHGHGGHGRGGGHSGGAVHRRAGYAAHAADLPHRRYFLPHRGRGGAPGAVGRQGEVHRRPRVGGRAGRVRGRHQGHTSESCSPARTSRRRTRTRKGSWWWIRRIRSGSSTATRSPRARSWRSRRATSSPRATTSAGRRSCTPGIRTTIPSIIKADGELRWKDLVPGVTLREELDEGTGLRSLVVMADPDRELHPSVLVYMPNRKDPQEYTLAEGSRVILGSPTDPVTRGMDIPDAANPWSTKFHVEERPINEAWPSKTKKESKDKTVFLSTPVKVTKGITVTKIPRQAYKTRDITGGLPRIAELFEARRPKDPATISEVDGVVKFGEIKRGKREIFVFPRRRQERRSRSSLSCTRSRPGSTSGCTRAIGFGPATG